MIQLALFNSRNKASANNESSLLPEEIALFDSLRVVLNQYREGILFSLLSNNQQGLPVKKEKPLKITSEINKDKPDLNRIRILATLPEFVGPDMNVYGPFEENQVTDLPEEISERLIGNNQAEVAE